MAHCISERSWLWILDVDKDAIHRRFKRSSPTWDEESTQVQESCGSNRSEPPAHSRKARCRRHVKRPAKWISIVTPYAHMTSCWKACSVLHLVDIHSYSSTLFATYGPWGGEHKRQSNLDLFRVSFWAESDEQVRWHQLH